MILGEHRSVLPPALGCVSVLDFGGAQMVGSGSGDMEAAKGNEASADQTVVLADLKEKEKRCHVDGAAVEEDMAELLKRLNLTSEEAEAVILEDENEEDLVSLKWALIGTVLSPNILHIQTIMSALRPAWGNPKGLTAKPVKKRLSELFEREEIMARQQSRVEWLREGDRNTSFFHARASARIRNNRIKFLRKDDGSRCEDPEGIKGMVYDFYTSLFTSEPSVSIDAVLEAIPKKVTKQINEALCREYTNDEIKAASKWDLLRPQA